MNACVIVCFYRISLKREAAVSKEVLSELSSGTGKKLSKSEKDERLARERVCTVSWTGV